jgi:hypothetical protein
MELHCKAIIMKNIHATEYCLPRFARDFVCPYEREKDLRAKGATSLRKRKRHKRTNKLTIGCPSKLTKLI